MRTIKIATKCVKYRLIPVLRVVLDLADVEQEPDASDVALGRRQVEGRPPVVVAHVHVHALVIGTAIGPSKVNY